MFPKTLTILATVLLCSKFSALAFAQSEKVIPQTEMEVEEIVISERHPGPSLWQVRNGDNVLWIIGLLRPLPKSFEWDSARVDWIISHSQEFITNPNVTSKTTNPLKMLSVGLKYQRLRKLSEDQTLSDILPPELYADSLKAWEQYAPQFDGMDETRPLFVAETLLNGALDSLDFDKNFDIQRELRTIARDHRVPITDNTINVSVDLALDAMSQTPMEMEIACLENTLASIESDLQSSAQRAQAWANGHGDALNSFEYPSISSACFVSAVQVEDAFVEAEKQSRDQWVEAVTEALKTNESTFTMLQIRELVDPEGLLAELREMGYEVAAP